jgi:hypothetical protein
MLPLLALLAPCLVLGGGRLLAQGVAVAPPAQSKAGIRICAGGDVTLGTNLDTSWAIRASRAARRSIPALPRPDRLLAPLVPLLRDADVVLVNVEGAIGSGPAARVKCREDSRNCYALRQPPAAARALRGLARHGAVVGNLANNHSRDAGPEGLEETTRLLSAAGVHTTGVDTLATPVVTARGDTVAFLGFSPFGGPDPRDLAGVRRIVSRAAQQYPRLVVTMHMGAEGRAAQRTPDSTEIYLEEHRGNPVAFARAAVESGAGLVVGHGPHVMRAMEWQSDALIAYSLGNLVTYGPFSLHPPLDRGGILCATLDARGRVLDAQLRPTRQRYPGLVSHDHTSRAVVLVDSLSRLDFPSTGARLVVEAGVRRP